MVSQAKAEGKAEGKTEGQAEGKTEGQLMIVQQLIEEKDYTYEQAADLMKIPVEEFAGKYEAFLKGAAEKRETQ
ncbi:MAG: hypothetical protein IKD69_02440, partial [Solobacterium sp.]|nr:hypothetical protein [Solobacterium sp.]